MFSEHEGTLFYPGSYFLPRCRKAARSGARTLLTSPPFVASAAESLLFDLCIKTVKELHSRSVFWRVYVSENGLSDAYVSNGKLPGPF